MIGRTIGSYRIIEKIGGGGMGVVYKAHDEKLDRVVALKFLPPLLSGTETQKLRFIREARAASALDDANVCTIYDIDETDDGQMYIAMAYCPGEPLDERIARGTLPIESCVAIAARVATGLASAHAADIIHRDIKPANIIVTDDDAVKIVDFGLAKLSSGTAITVEGTTMGTVAYMSPEQARGQDVDHRTDVWSLGAVVYEMVSGRRPFRADHDSAQLYLIMNEEPEHLASLRGDIPAALADVVHRMLEKDRNARFRSMNEVIAALEAALSGEPVAPGDALGRARDATRRYDWNDAFEAYNEARAGGEVPAKDLENMGYVGQWMGEYDWTLEAWEKAHAGYVKAGRAVDAARVATELANHAFFNGRRSVCNGWIRRAERMLENAPESVEKGYLIRLKAKIAIEADTELDTALDLIETVEEYANRFDDRNLHAYALQDRGRALILKDRVTEGMELLEEAMSLAISGELGPEIVGTTYCNMISMCDRIADYRSAGEWSDSAVTWCEPHSGSGFQGVCRVHRADVMRVRGDWEYAESETERAIENSEGFMPMVAGEAYYVKGEILAARGDLDGAEACFQKAHQRGRHPVPGLAMLRLAQGNVGAARSLIDRALAADLIALDRVKLLPAGVAVALAAGDIETAHRRADELSSLARGYDSTVFLAQAEYARGNIALDRKKIEDALASFTTACSHWKEADMPLDEAQTRAQMAEAYWAGGEDGLAELEARSARNVFEKLGALPDLERIDALIEKIKKRNS